MLSLWQHSGSFVPRVINRPIPEAIAKLLCNLFDVCARHLKNCPVPSPRCMIAIGRAIPRRKESSLVVLPAVASRLSSSCDISVPREILFYSRMRMVTLAWIKGVTNARARREPAVEAGWRRTDDTYARACRWDDFQQTTSAGKYLCTAFSLGVCSKKWFLFSRAGMSPVLALVCTFLKYSLITRYFINDYRSSSSERQERSTTALVSEEDSCKSVYTTLYMAGSKISLKVSSG